MCVHFAHTVFIYFEKLELLNIASIKFILSRILSYLIKEDTSLKKCKNNGCSSGCSRFIHTRMQIFTFPSVRKILLCSTITRLFTTTHIRTILVTYDRIQMRGRVFGIERRPPARSALIASICTGLLQAKNSYLVTTSTI